MSTEDWMPADHYEAAQVGWPMDLSPAKKRRDDEDPDEALARVKRDIEEAERRYHDALVRAQTAVAVLAAKTGWRT